MTAIFRESKFRIGQKVLFQEEDFLVKEVHKRIDRASGAYILPYCYFYTIRSCSTDYETSAPEEHLKKKKNV